MELQIGKDSSHPAYVRTVWGTVCSEVVYIQIERQIEREKAHLPLCVMRSYAWLCVCNSYQPVASKKLI